MILACLCRFKISFTVSTIARNDIETAKPYGNLCQIGMCFLGLTFLGRMSYRSANCVDPVQNNPLLVGIVPLDVLSEGTKQILEGTMHHHSPVIYLPPPFYY